MQTFQEALEQGFKILGDSPPSAAFVFEQLHPWATHQNGYWSFKFGDGYELCFEPLLWDNQYYVALYKDHELLTNKVCVKPGK